MLTRITMSIPGILTKYVIETDVEVVPLCVVNAVNFSRKIPVGQ